MKIEIVQRNYAAKEKLTDLIEKKVQKFEKYLDEGASAKVVLSKSGKQERYKMEVTLKSRNIFVRSEVESDNMYVNLDTCLAKLERQIVKNNKKYKNKFAERLIADTLEFLEEEPASEPYKVVKKKTFELDPMTVEDAEAYMEAVGHSFYVFLNAETGEINVLYKRNDGNLGLIEAKK